ncbi:unnamed protein product [Clonostachys solani]|uniref:Protein kinase domain-containing protein n=1 Tax=Clonostachys solani TaxID=160281 RepID=A0A9N9Z0V9_9HYPO|nr:unnamed protein product [Clonostachys solani]
MERTVDNGRAFKAKFRQRIRSNGVKPSTPQEHPRPPLPKAQQYNYLYGRDQKANILNVISVISEEIPPNKRISVYPRIGLDDAPVIGRGATFEVLTKNWQKNGELKRVAVKRIRRDHIPCRNPGLPLQDDYVYLKERDVFYSKVEDILQELRIMANEDLAWDSIDDTLFAPIMIVELASLETPTIQHYFQAREKTQPLCVSTVRSFIADVADGLTALHFSNVLHSDLKPSNILLFHYQSSEALVAKISDFGYADSDRMIRKEDSEVRGGTREWAAPELLSGCPQSIRTLARVAPTVSDVFSFGLLAFYMGTGGVSPAKIGGWTMDQLDEIKFNGDTFRELQKHSAVNISDLGNSLFNEEPLVSAVRDSLRLEPTQRLATLGGMRSVLFGSDQYKKEKMEHRFRARPFVSFVSRSLPLSSIVHPNLSLNKIALDSLPKKLRIQAEKLVGSETGLFEPMAHSLRRGQFFPKTYKTQEDTTQPERVGRLSIDQIQYFPSLAGEIFAIGKVALGQTFTAESAVADLLQTECIERPRIFTLIDGNNISAVQQELLLDSSQAMIQLPMESGGWYPLHLAAELGRVEIVKLLLNTEGVGCDVRSGQCQLTPLHLAVNSEEPAVVQLLLDSGAQIDARYYIPNSGYIRDMTPLDLAVEAYDESRGGIKQRMKIIRLLLHRGADYLHNNAGRGFSVVFRAALKSLDLLKVFFDSIPPEEARLLVTIIDDLGSTLLSSAAGARQVETVKYLLSKGADPGARDRLGRTIFVRLEGDRVFKGSALGIVDQAMPYLSGNTPRQWDKGTDEIIDLIKATGSLEATAYDDFCFSSTEIHEMFGRARLRSSKSFASKLLDALKSPSFGRRLHHSMIIFREISSQVHKFESLDLEAEALQLKKQLLEWQQNRQTGRIPMDVLPEEWRRGLRYFGNISPGIWEELFIKDELPQLVELLNLTLVSLLDAFFRHNGFQVIYQFVNFLEEVDKRGLLTEFFNAIYTLCRSLLALRKHDPRSMLRKGLLGMHVRDVWKILKTGEILDRLFNLLVVTGMKETVDQTINHLPVVFEARAVAPLASTIQTLRLAERYPGSQMFVTGTSLNIPPFRILIALLQIVIFTLPAIAYTSQWLLVFWQHSSMNIFLLLAIWRTRRPSDWVLFDNFQIHPNVGRGIRAVLALIIFRLRHPWVLEEPLIISVPHQSGERVDIASAMHYIPAGRSNVFYFLSISNCPKLESIPCYTAMGELMDGWKNGTLPRKGWCNGWWELNQFDEWVRINAAGKPSLSSYSEASKHIKEILSRKQRDEVYESFLRERDYWLDTPAEQLSKMKQVFGEENDDCFQIWARLYLREPIPRLSYSYLSLPALHNFLQSVADYSWM